jgi:transcription antitermination protein NusB
VTARAERRAAPRPAGESRHAARAAALQMLYQWEVGRLSIAEIREQFWQQTSDLGQPVAEDLRLFATRLAEGVVSEVEQLDPMISEAAENWRLERMNVMDRLILRLALHEFLHESETPAAVIINEALELARSFSSDEAVGFINGILDAVRRKLERE